MSFLHKNLCVIALFVITTFSSMVYAQDACVSVVGNLVGASNCGFDDSSIITPWTALAGTLVVGSVNPSPGGTNYGIINPAVIDSNSIYSIRSGQFNLAANTTYNISFYLKGTTATALVDDINLIPLSGSGLFNLQSNLTVGSANWTQLTYSITTGASVDNPLRFGIEASVPSPGSPASISIDSLVIVQVPEPATLILLGSLCSAVVGYKYTRKRNLNS